MIARTRCYRLPEPAPIWEQLAVEECLFDVLAPDEMILLLWRSEPSVVIGRNQNPWRECRFDRLAAARVALARRRTGGGAVYHDAGNLNFSFIGWRTDYDAGRISGWVRQALERLGLRIEIGARHILCCGGDKISGNAFAFRQGKVLHHGTLLVDADLECLHACLERSLAVETRAVASVPSPVGNLRDYAKGVDVALVAEAVQSVFRSEFPATRCRDCADDLDPGAIAALTRMYRSWGWRFGETPAFRCRLTNAFAWGELTLLFTVEKGVVTAADVENGPGDSVLTAAVAACRGRRFEGNALRQACDGRDRRRAELAHWLKDLSL